MTPDHEEARDQLGDSKAQRTERTGGAALPMEKRKHDQIRNEGNTGEEREHERVEEISFAPRTWGLLDQQDDRTRQNDIISGQKVVIAEQKGGIAGRDELISGLQLLNKGLTKWALW
jgi:hypothetical protein